jgi:uncharacterized protein (DUF58 family)
MDHRDYQPGDDLRRIDWSAYARSDRLALKLYREETHPHVDILIDGSRSMCLEDSAKDRATLGLAALLAAAAENAGFTHAVHVAERGWQRLARGDESPLVWQPPDLDGTASPLDAMNLCAPPLVPRGIRIFISDLLWLGDPAAMVARLADRAASVVIIQILAEADTRAPAAAGSLRLIDSESGLEHEIFVDAVAERRYRDALQRHQQNWNRAARRLGARLTTLVAEPLVDGWNLEELVLAGILKVADR